MTDTYRDDALERLVSTLCEAVELNYDVAALIIRAVNLTADRVGRERLLGEIAPSRVWFLDDVAERGAEVSVVGMRQARVLAYVKSANVPVTAEDVARVSGIPDQIVATDLADLASRDAVTLYFPNPPTYI